MFGCYLMFNRNCAEALDVYTEAFGAKVIEKQTFGEVSNTNPFFKIDKDDETLISYSKIKIGNMYVVCVDSSERSLPGFNTYVFVKEEAEFIRKAWEVLKQEASIYADLAPTTFAALHGSLRDKFGINWMFTVPNPKVPKVPKTAKLKTLQPKSKSAPKR